MDSSVVQPRQFAALVAGWRQHCFHSDEWRRRGTGFNFDEATFALVDLEGGSQERKRNPTLQSTSNFEGIAAWHAW